MKGNIFIKSKAKVKNYMTNKNLERFEKSRSKKLGKPYIPASKKNKGFKKYDSSYKRTESPFTLDLNTLGQPKGTAKRVKNTKFITRSNKEMGLNKYGAREFRSPALEYVSGGAAKLLGGAARMAYNIFKRSKPAKVGSKVNKKLRNKK